LDQIISNNPQIIKEVDIEAPVSNNDHCTISFSLNILCPKPKPYKRLIWLYANADYSIFRNNLVNIDYSFCNELNSLDDIVEKWTTIFLETAKRSLPNKIAVIRPNDKPWFKGYHRKLLRKKLRIHKMAKKKNTPQMWLKFKKIRNENFNALKAAKK
jgi:hypothetical protein